MAENTIPYNDNPESDDYCPNPDVFLSEVIAQFAGRVRGFVCDEVSKGADYTDEKIAELKAQVDSIESAEGLAERLQEIKNFLDSLDEDGDGVLDQLLGIQKLAQEAYDLASSNKGKIDEHSSTINSIQVDLSEHIRVCNAKFLSLEQAQSTLDAQIKTLKTDVSTLKTGQQQHDARISSLEEIAANMSEVTVDRMHEILCANNAKVSSALSKAFEAFDASLAVGCDWRSKRESGSGSGSTEEPKTEEAPR